MAQVHTQVLLLSVKDQYINALSIYKVHRFILPIVLLHYACHPLGLTNSHLNRGPLDMSNWQFDQPDLQADHSLVHLGLPLHAVVGSRTTPIQQNSHIIYTLDPYVTFHLGSLS